MNHKGVVEWSDINSFSDITNSMYKFRRFSYNGREDWMNIFDQPGHMFFKILFHFENGDYANGLLGVSDMDFSSERVSSFSNIIDQNAGVESYRDKKSGDPVSGQKYLSNTAFHYLLRNNELTRANMLVDFVELLSEINSNHPWYWKSISGLESLMERKILTKEVKIEDEPSKITIKCLEDSYDSRIGTLLDLYKSICYDYYNKREIVPANLRKFDMDICIFQAPTKSMHKIKTRDGLLTSLADDLLNKNYPPTSELKYPIPDHGSVAQQYTSCKVIHLRNCEFVFNSTKSGYGELTNDEGFKNEYSIDIAVNDAFENRFNEVLGYNIGDFITFSDYKDDGRPTDMSSDTSRFQTKTGLATKLDVVGMVDNLTNTVVSKTKSLAKGLTLGNLHTTSLSNISNFISNPSQSINSTVSGAVGRAINDAIAGNNKRKTIDSSVGKLLPGYPTFEEKMAKIKGRFNSNRNLFNSI